MVCYGTGTGTVTFQKSEPEPDPQKIVTVPQHCNQAPYEGLVNFCYFLTIKVT
jgi:hypothetical protein